MNGLLRLLAISFAVMAPCRAIEGLESLHVTSDGSLQFQSLHGSIHWSGNIAMEHPRFQLQTQGQATLFGGPGIHRKQIGTNRLKEREVSFEPQWISLVVTGRIEISVVGKNGTSEPIKAERVVYLPKTDQLLIDGKPYDPEASSRKSG